jgi:hypothetical protein
MQILNTRPSGRIALALHASFLFVYLLLVTRLAISLYEGPTFFQYEADPSLVILIIKRLAGIVYQPFFAFFVGPSYGNTYFIVTLDVALFIYGLIHYGIFMTIAVEGSSFVADKILKLCRAFFFFAGALLLLLIVARMGVMLYQDLVFGRFPTVLRAPASK